ncbi:hemolysin family protein [Hydrogenothermus marinus]|uniref:CBS domain containing-hemolysin-like protein n=1 Tax=Hydrogenothermus marinus TaxID=133270 RepID=A0A3M0BKR6_9AQUI|nr:hemolysin family protein [Hydrogenothermus marinus]RMA97737.1 CBS domain containing-hemolysin-like protein [Hydrogenothermus marinus]
MISYIITIVFFLILEAFFSGSEIALFSINKAKLKYLAENGDKKAEKIYKLLSKHFDDYIATTLIGTTLSIVTITAVYVQFLMKTAEFLPFLHSKEELFAESIVIFTLLFGEILPKSVFQHFSEKIIYFLVPVLEFFRKLFIPFILFANLITKIIFFVFRIEPKKEKILNREELLDVLLMESEGLEELEKKIIANVLIFEERRLGEIVVPLSDVVAVSENAKIEEVIPVFQSTGFSRIPVFSKRIDEIVGVIRAYDLAYARPEEKIKKYANTIRYLPEFTSLPMVLKGFKTHKDHMAVVVDERGATMGIITLEDVLEEIVGEIRDEYAKKEKKMIKKTLKDKLVVDGRIELKEIETLLDIKFPTGPYETLGGWMIYTFGRMPKIGESLNFDDYIFKVLKTSRRRIREIMIEKTNSVNEQ